MLALAAMGEVCAAFAQAPSLAQIAFSSGGRIYLMNADGSGRHALTRGPTRSVAADREPAWSPDGSTIAFTRNFQGGENPRSRIYLMRSDGGDQRPLTRSPRVVDASPAWSPDGRRLAFFRGVEGKASLTTSIVLIGRDGRGERILTRQRLAPRFEEVSEPRWSPDGRSIAFTRVVLGRKAFFHPTIYLLGVGGGKPRLLAREASSPSWSPDGSRIAFVSVRDRNGENCGSDECSYNGEIYVMSAGGGSQVRLTRNDGNDVNPRWSADGGRIVFASDRNYPDGESPEIYSIRPDGSCLTWLTNGVPASYEPDWKPDVLASSDPGACGATARPALVDVGIGAALNFTRYPLYWLDFSYGALLLSDFSLDSTGAFFAYEDCAKFDPGLCPSALQLNEDTVCSANSLLPDLGSLAQRLLKVRGTLVATFPDAPELVLYSGTAEMHIGAQTRPDDPKVIAQLLPVVDSLQPVRGALQAAGSLAAPTVPSYLADRLKRTRDVYRKLHSLRAAAKQLKLSRDTVRSQLRLLNALESVGPLQTFRCRQPVTNLPPPAIATPG